MSEESFVFEDRDALSRAAAAFIAESAREALARAGRFTLVLAGGSTPGRTYELLAADAAMPWERTHLFIGDERFVAPDDPESNLGTIRERLLDRIAIPDENQHFIDTTASSADEAALRYESALRSFFGGDPHFDLVLLGMGADGHTASIFPDMPAPDPTRLVAPATAPPSYPTRTRVTLTKPAIDAARDVLFLVAGADKSAAFRTARGEARATIPAGGVRPKERLVWFVDAAAL